MIFIACFRREARFDQQLVVALVAVAGDRADAARIRAGAEQTARLHERALELHRLLEGDAMDAVVRRLPALVECARPAWTASG